MVALGAGLAEAVVDALARLAAPAGAPRRGAPFGGMMGGCVDDQSMSAVERLGLIASEVVRSENKLEGYVGGSSSGGRERKGKQKREGEEGRIG